jgi:small-conductance mechanosensitive channel
MGAALLSAGRPQWRLAPISEGVVARLAPFPALIAAAAGLATLAAGVNSILASSLATSVAGDCLTVLGEIAAVGGALAMVGRARHEHLVSNGDAEAAGTAGGRIAWVAAALAAWLALGGALISVLTGYLALASFLMHETIWIGAVLAAVYLLLHFVDDVFPALFAPDGPAGRAIKTGVGFSDSALEQLGVLLSGAFRLALLLVGWTIILAPFGASADDIVGRFTTTSWVLQIGQVSISAGSVLGALGLFLIGLFLTRAVRGWLETRYLPKTQMDLGVRTSVAVAVNYAGVIFAILFAFAYLGLSFSQIALLASALSVGIGFGLQAIIGNFVSGLILLAERPIKVGDWIAIGDLEGDVKAINIRATEIEMMDKSKLIVPNSDLVSKTVRNVTHGAAAARLRIGLKTDASVDPNAVREIVLGRMRAHPEVLAQPAASMFLSDIRDGALEFTAFAFVASARSAYRVKSELLFQIVPDLQAKGIALASSTPVVNIGLHDRLIEPDVGKPD